MAIRVIMTYGTRLSTKFYSLYCVQYCKNNFKNIIEHVAIKDSNTILYVGGYNLKKLNWEVKEHYTLKSNGLQLWRTHQRHQ